MKLVLVDARDGYFAIELSRPRHGILARLIVARTLTIAVRMTTFHRGIVALVAPVPVRLTLPPVERTEQGQPGFVARDWKQERVSP